MCEQTFSDNYSQEFVIYNETGIDISFIVAYHHQNRKKQLHIVGWYVHFHCHQSLA